MAKDLDLAWDLFRRSGAETPLALLAEDLFTRAAQDHGGLDIPALAEIFRRP